MDIRILSEHDAIEYRSLRLKALKTEPSSFGSTYERESEFSLDKFKKRLRPADNNFVVGAFNEDTLICAATFIRMDGTKDRHKSMIVGMYCDEEHRGTGISRDVVDFLLEETQKIDGVEMVYLSVVSDNQRAKNFYHSFGFKVYGTEPKALYDGDRYYDEDLMYLELTT